VTPYEAQRYVYINDVHQQTTQTTSDKTFSLHGEINIHQTKSATKQLAMIQRYEVTMPYKSSFTKTQQTLTVH